MRKLTTVLMVLSLVLMGITWAAAADLPQTSKEVDLSGFTKITDKEAQEIKGTYMGSANMFGNTGITCPNTTCVPKDYNYNNSQYNSTCIPKLWESPGPHKN